MSYYSQESMSWERASSSWDSRPDAESELLVFGYSAKLFKDDVQAQSIEDGNHLIPWMGHQDNLIDRFDVRGCLHDLTRYEASGSNSQLNDQEKVLEKALDDERFRDLNDALEEQEEEMRRLRRELEVEGAFSQVPYDYGDDQTSETQKEEVTEVKDEPPDFKVPNSLDIPSGITLPKYMKEHNLMEKTAAFICQAGPQMEIILKLKQADNQSFSFLNLESPLNPYFKYLLSVIKTGHYQPKKVEEDKVINKEEQSSDSDSDSDGGYLHPSLFAASSSKKPAGFHPKEQTSSILGVKLDSGVSSQAPPKGSKSFSLLPSPPPAIELIIEKLAERVAQAGDEFEQSVKNRGDPRFDFLNPGHCFHAHYVMKKMHHLQEQNVKLITGQKKATESTQDSQDNKTCDDKKEDFSPKKMSFKVKSIIVSSSSSAQTSKPEANKEDEDEMDEITKLIEATASSSETSSRKTSSIDSELADKLSMAARDKLKQEKKLQEERKRKAALFLKMVREKEEVKDGKKDEKDKRSDVKLSSIQPVLPFTASDQKIKNESIKELSSSSSSRHHHRKEKKRKRSRSRLRSRDRDSRERRRRSRSR